MRLRSIKCRKSFFLSPLLGSQSVYFPLSSAGADGVCPPALRTEIQQLSNHISETIAYRYRCLKHRGRRKKFRGGQKVKNNLEYYEDEKKKIQLV